MVKIQPNKAPPATNAIKKDKKSDLILRTKNKQLDLYLFLSSCQRKLVIIKNKKAPSFSISESFLFYLTNKSLDSST